MHDRHPKENFCHLLTFTGMKAFPCEHCKKSFSRKFDLTLHLLIHSRRSHSDVIIAWNWVPFSQKKLICWLIQREAIRSLWSLQEVFFIKEQSQTSFTDSFWREVISLWSVQDTFFIKVQSQTSFANPFYCDHCGKRFARKSNLTRSSLTYSKN